MELLVGCAHENAIEIRAAWKKFGEFVVLNNISLSVRRGEVVVLCGPSGSGKSTLLRCMNGLETLQSGECWVNGVDVKCSGATLRKLRADCAMIFQQFNLYPHLTTLENVALAPRRVLALRRSDSEIKARKMLARVGLEDKINAYPSQLSGGQQQRVAIARALAMDPIIILFDEPTSALDPEMVNEVLGVMTALASEGRTMVVVTHEMGFARRVAHRVVFMESGQIIEEGLPGEIFANASDLRTQQFFQQIMTY